MESSLPISLDMLKNIFSLPTLTVECSLNLNLVSRVIPKYLYAIVYSIILLLILNIFIIDVSAFWKDYISIFLRAKMEFIESTPVVYSDRLVV